jgi:hypothetical protein
LSIAAHENGQDEPADSSFCYWDRLPFGALKAALRLAGVWSMLRCGRIAATVLVRDLSHELRAPRSIGTQHSAAAQARMSALT